MTEQNHNGLSRRQLLRTVAWSLTGLSGAQLLAACSPAAPVASNPPAAAPPAAVPTTAAVQAAAAAPTIAPQTVPATVVAAAGAARTGADAGFMRAPEGTVKRGGTARHAGQISTAHYDAHQGANIWAVGPMYNNLVRLNLADGLKTIIPDLAESWDISLDGKTYTFTMRDGVQFHDGTPLTAADAQATFQRIIFPPQGMISVLKNLFDSVDKIESTDPRTLRFTLKEGRPWLLEAFTNPTCIVYSKKALDANNQDLRKVIAPGTGAFVNKEVREGEKWIMAKNPNYWDKELPYVDTLEMVHLPEWTDRGTAVLTDQADLTLNSSVEMVLEAQNRPDIVTARQVPSSGVYLVYYNVAQKPFDDPRVRRAINLTLNHQDIIQAFGNNEGIKFSRWIPRASTYATSEDQLATMPGYRHDKAEDIPVAKKLLADASLADGFQNVDLVSASVASHSQILAPAIQEQLKRGLNVDAKIRVVERGVLSQELTSGKFGLSVFATTMTTTLDPAPLWNQCFKTGGSQNLGRYANPKFDELLAQINRETDIAARKKLVSDTQDLLDQDPPWFVIGWVDHNPIWRNTTKGMALDQRPVSELGRMETIWLAS